jgi:hypothetical protein
MSVAMRLVLPGPWMTTNQALSAQRAEGYYHGFGQGMEQAGYGRVEPPFKRPYADRAREARNAVVQGVSRCAIPPIGDGPWVLFVVARHHDDRVDTDGVSIMAKWILDGLVDAGTLAQENEVTAVVTSVLTAFSFDETKPWDSIEVTIVRDDGSLMGLKTKEEVQS